MSELQYLSVGYLLFMILIVAEAAFGWWRDKHVYRIGEAIVNIGHGVVFQVGDLFTKALFMLPFVWLSNASGPHVLSVQSWWGWVVGLFAYDFCTYWRHRHHHEVNFLWAVHSCHHAAEDFNFAGALRQALFGNVLGWLWTLPLALVMPFEMFVGIIVIDYIYQFVQHTQHVPKLGPLEALLNTPSHHRVHHGTEPEYLDRNYGGIFIIWDRLFGTFAEERGAPTFGLTHPLGTLNPVWANFAPWLDLWRASKRARSRHDAIKLWFVGPSKLAALAPDGPRRQRGELANKDIPTSLARFVVGTFTVNVAMLVALIWTPAQFFAAQMLLAATVVAQPAIAGAFLEQKAWAWRAELARGLAMLLALTAVEMPAFAQYALGASLLTSVALIPTNPLWEAISRRQTSY